MQYTCAKMAATPETRGISQQNRVLLEQLHRAGPGPFDVADATSLWGMEHVAAGRRMRMLAARGWLARSGPGLYLPVPLDAARSGEWTEDPWLTVAKLFPDGYIGGWTACEHWGLTDQVFRELFVFSPTRLSRDLEVGGTPVKVKLVRPGRLFGIRTAWRRSVRVRVSDPTRTLVDLLDDPSVGGGIRHVADIVDSYLSGSHRDDDLLLEYSERLGNRTVFKRLGYLIETLGLTAPDLASACRTRMSAGVTLLDPSQGTHGPIVSRWRLRINADVSR